ncbi:hypothetical protein RB2150_06768 [Rhodobacterales bacterium HTCC2150]|nr:hypothetical protein RB2150_06768 [Rhodobacterales bacterium HTCC2150] [Rhodobacteraceae bacterium HTCC2150]
MDDREELRRLIDVLEKGSGSSSLEQAIDDDPKDYTIHKKQETMMSSLKGRSTITPTTFEVEIRQFISRTNDEYREIRGTVE